MNKNLLWLLLLFLLAGCAAPVPEALPESSVLPEEVLWETETSAAPPADPNIAPVSPSAEDFVLVTDYIPDLLVDLKYATEDNFTGQAIYGFSQSYLRFGTVEKLMAVQEDLHQLDLGLKLWDGFRPIYAQFSLWEACPDTTYVADPRTGYSDHSRGNTVDVTLVDSQGREVSMPTGFDDFSSLADRDYTDCPGDAASYAKILELLMEKHGFQGYWGEWWHYTDIQTYPVEKDFDPSTQKTAR